MIKIKCHNCSYSWNYRGVKVFYCTCPNCYYKVNIKKNTISEGSRVKNGER